MEISKSISDFRKDSVLMGVLQERISEVQKSINKISVLREELEENARNVKAEVEASVGDQLNHLHQREIQLIRQVDALISHQSSVLQLQLSRLYQSLGALKSALQWVQQGGNVDVEKIGDVAVGPIQTRHLHYKPTSQSSLESSIMSFGRVEAKNSSANVLMLPDEEDYGDGDHHVLHKALNSDYLSKIHMHFPKMDCNRDVWLSDLKVKNDEQYENEKFLCKEPEKEKWLCDLKGQCDLEDFEMGDVSETSESIELLSHPDAHDNNLWLQSSTKPKDNKSMCNCLDKGNVEIENLDILNCIPNKPTNYNKVENCVPPLSVPEISTVCRSNNSKCKAYSDCICDENCLVACLKEQMKDLKMQEITKQDCINEVIRATTCCMQQQKCQESYDWLLHKEAVNENVTDWLKHCSQNQNQMNVGNGNSFANGWLKVCCSDTDKLDKIHLAANEQNCRFVLPNYLTGFEAANWIKSYDKVKCATYTSKVKDSEYNMGSWLSLISTPATDENIQTKAMKEMFASYFQHVHSVGKWVAYDSDYKVQMDWLASCP